MKQQALTTGRNRSLRRAISADYLAPETGHVRRLARQAKLLPGQQRRVEALAGDMIQQMRRRKLGRDGFDAFLHEYDLSTTEGIAILCMAEALLRIPDTATRDALIQDSLQRADWHSHLGHSDSALVDAATWGLLLSSRVIRMAESINPLDSTFKKLLARRGEPLIRESIVQAMRVVGGHFVSGEDMTQALRRAAPEMAKGYRYSFDMLGEAALTAVDAERYETAYHNAIVALHQHAQSGDLLTAPGISVKLSALHPRFHPLQAERVGRELTPRLLELARAARDANLSLTVDAEEAERLELTLDCFAAVYRDDALAGWEGLGLAVQAYQKRAPAVIEWLTALAQDRGRRIPLRLVKGAYWDTEIKRAQQLGLAGYPVYTRKPHTDVSYMACVKQMFQAQGTLLPQFATHNAHSIAVVQTLAPPHAEYEFQRLHGMGANLYDPLVEAGLPCRVYAPVGSHAHLLAYLVRRLLENGANSSFINQAQERRQPIADLIRDPVTRAREKKCQPHPNIPLPADLYAPQRQNSMGTDLGQPDNLAPLTRALSRLKPVAARPLVPGFEGGDNAKADPVHNPAKHGQIIGSVISADRHAVDQALHNARQAADHWNAAGIEARAAILERAAERFTLLQSRFAALLVSEAGKTWPAALAEVRETIDLCRYYAQQARATLLPRPMPGPTGEQNTLTTHGRGPMLCISPWNFPLAIFVGQIAAALVAGNPVIAKPASLTPLTAFTATRLLHKAGVPESVLQFLPGDGTRLGKRLLADTRIQGVLFTGSFTAAQTLQRQLATRPGPIVPLIAETGGVNAMLVDSSALPEQVVTDALRSAFDSAGQRCSALRLLCLQEDIAEAVESMLSGAMAQLQVGEPAQIDTDVGPLIDGRARTAIQRHLRRLKGKARVIAEAPINSDCKQGHFLAPVALAIDDIDTLRGEVFGPVLHVLRYRGDEFESLIERINAKGYGLTGGLHSRLISRQESVQKQLRVGNLYINRDLIAAVPGVQPFGGQGLSGSGPKSGGPNYLLRLVNEQTLCINSAAMGGNASLLTQSDED